MLTDDEAQSQAQNLLNLYKAIYSINPDGHSKKKDK